METILIGKPYTLRWMVNTNGHQSSLSGRDIKLYIITPKGVVVCADGHWHASDNNIVLSLWQDFQYDYGSGCYALKAVENEGKDGESCFVINPAFAMTHNNDEVGDDGEDAEGNIVISVDEAISIADIVQMTTSTESEGENVIKVVLTDGRVKTFVVRNGKKGLRGLRGLKGNDGDPGEQGDSGISEEEKQTLLDAVEDINEAILESNAATQQASKVNAEIVGDVLYVTNKYGVTKSYQLASSGASSGADDTPGEDNTGGEDTPSGGNAGSVDGCTCTPYDDTEIRGMIAGKQATISDLEAIRTGAAAGATALQPQAGKVLSSNDFTDTYKQKIDGALQKPASNGISGQMLVLNNEGKLVWQNVPTPNETPGDVDGCTCTPYDDTEIRGMIAGKQATISDLEAIRTGAAAGATALQPQAGKVLSSNDFTNDYKNKIDAALQKPSSEGTTGQILARDENGNLTWISMTPGAGSSITTYNNVYYFDVDVHTKNYKNSIAFRVNEKNDECPHDENITAKDHCVLRLPSGHNSSAKPLKLVVYFHGSGEAVYATKSAIVNHAGTTKIPTSWFVKCGYALVCVNGMPETYATANGVQYSRPRGNWMAIESSIKAVQYVCDNYNIDINELYVYGESQGGMTALNFIECSGMKVKACVLDSPALSMKYHQMKIGADTEGNLSDMQVLYGFNNLETYNDEAVRGLDPYSRLCTVVENPDDYEKTYDKILKTGEEEKITSKRIALCPTKFFLGFGDVSARAYPTQIVAKQMKNYGQIVDVNLYNDLGHCTDQQGRTVATFVLGETTYDLSAIEIDMSLWFSRFGGNNIAETTPV